MSKDYGIAQSYTALRVGPIVVITAVGQAPNFNTQVTVEQLPWRIYPPLFGLFFETPAIQLPAIRPFAVAGVFPYPEKETELTIFDAAGRHAIRVASAFPFEPLEREAAGREDFIAYQQIGVANCMIAPADAMVPMIYRRAFGPASYPACEAWIAKNCQPQGK